MTNSKRRIIGMIGCMAKNRGEEIFKKMPHLDLICSPASFDKIPEYIEKIKTEGLRIINLEDRAREEIFYHPLYRSEPGHAQVVISTGCSNYCSYCVVPFVRGELRLRTPRDILDEVKRNIGLGIKKITLLGQNVNDYLAKPQINFVELLKMVSGIEGVEEVDFITSHPKNTSRELFQLMAKIPKIKKHLHLPFQSGSDRILKLMNRGYTSKDYLNLVNDYRQTVNGVIAADLIVGFPTETEEDFLRTKEILEKIEFDYAYIFKYSPRPNTAAGKLNDDVKKEEKQRRHKILLDLQKKISLSKKDRKIKK